MSVHLHLHDNMQFELLKDNVLTISNALEKIMSLRGVTYTPNNTANDYGFETVEQVGVLAQDVQAVLPQLVHLAPFDVDPATGLSKSGSNYLTVDYEKLTPVLIEAVKQQQVMIAALNDRIGDLEDRLNK